MARYDLCLHVARHGNQNLVGCYIYILKVGYTRVYEYLFLICGPRHKLSELVRIFSNEIFDFVDSKSRGPGLDPQNGAVVSLGKTH